MFIVKGQNADRIYICNHSVQYQMNYIKKNFKVIRILKKCINKPKVGVDRSFMIRLK